MYKQGNTYFVFPSNFKKKIMVYCCCYCQWLDYLTEFNSYVLTSHSLNCFQKFFNFNVLQLCELPIPLRNSQCATQACYSYHKLKNEYEFTCEYPSYVELWGHCIELVDNDNKDNNKITLLSFGGDYNHTLMMKYLSVWSNISNKSNEVNNYNQWILFIYNHNHPIIIGRNNNYTGMFALIGRRNTVCCKEN
ncbi:hypothetical protein RFI_34331 [Reticulomyxa filosa]|uniref:Uncharacterized protein n=1 Tax=Reticulomyxa filosa TaxID=46433 RepID=X6LN87_RETFI|nr:hypothetical protein RFI_34331 [Reticulomyxa filosa]|eukprot:ETO03079.1 hypothetical protein RFI_34331 [Reticulomyxa filosa]